MKAILNKYVLKLIPREKETNHATQWFVSDLLLFLVYLTPPTT